MLKSEKLQPLLRAETNALERGNPWALADPGVCAPRSCSTVRLLTACNITCRIERFVGVFRVDIYTLASFVVA